MMGGSRNAAANEPSLNQVILSQMWPRALLQPGEELESASEAAEGEEVQQDLPRRNPLAVAVGREGEHQLLGP